MDLEILVPVGNMNLKPEDVMVTIPASDLKRIT
jgi:hypothetical protein